MTNQQSLNWLKEYFKGNETEQDIEAFEKLQELIDNYKQLKNEFCLQCGKYKNAHYGACEGCIWK